MPWNDMLCPSNMSHCFKHTKENALSGSNSNWQERSFQGGNPFQTSDNPFNTVTFFFIRGAVYFKEVAIVENMCFFKQPLFILSMPYSYHSKHLSAHWLQKAESSSSCATWAMFSFKIAPYVIKT